MEQNVLMTIEYDGSGFSGWQRQPDKRTVQGELEKVLSVLCRQPIKINGTSRTDAGVHALGQRASFKGDFGIPVERLAGAANNLLAGGMNSFMSTGDVRIKECKNVDKDFHARFDSKGKLYRYIIQNGGEVNVFRRNYCYFVEKKLNLRLMKQGACYIEGTHDFRCFQASGGQERETTVRTVHHLDIYEKGNDVIIEISGDGFLYNMVRIITGTLVEIGLGKKSPESVEQTIASCDRQNAGHTAPPQGLYLVEVYY